jgi:hypothetical protein
MSGLGLLRRDRLGDFSHDWDGAESLDGVLVRIDLNQSLGFAWFSSKIFPVSSFLCVSELSAAVDGLSNDDLVRSVPESCHG